MSLVLLLELFCVTSHPYAAEVSTRVPALVLAASYGSLMVCSDRYVLLHASVLSMGMS